MQNKINAGEWNIGSGDYQFPEEYVSKHKKVKEKEDKTAKTATAIIMAAAALASSALIYLAGNVRI